MLYISSDGPRDEDDGGEIKAVREYIKSITGFAQVVSFFPDRNVGVFVSYTNLISSVFEVHDSLIFLEDDVVVAPDFLEYMNRGLAFYQGNTKVFSISAFSFSVFHEVIPLLPQVHFTNRFYPWGFGIWKDRFMGIPPYQLSDVRNSLMDASFLLRLNNCGADLYPAFLSLLAQNKMLVLDYLYTYHMVKNNLVTVVPYQSKSFNIGHDGSGSRTVKVDKYLSVDTSFLEKANPVEFVSDIDAHIDNRFNQLQFRRNVNGVKLILYRLGLLSIAMKVVNVYRMWSRR